MIKIEKIETYGWEAAIRGMRNPLNSWDKIDSFPCHLRHGGSCKDCKIHGQCDGSRDFVVGPNDLKLMKTLGNAGADHGKFLRMITVTMDITCHHAWWAEFDTYKIGTTRNSCSKMHKIHSKEFFIQDFSHEGCSLIEYADDALRDVISTCERLRCDYNRTGDKAYWRALLELLPMGYNMKATVFLNYQVLKNIYHARKNHKLFEWRLFCSLIESLPYSELITGVSN